MNSRSKYKSDMVVLRSLLFVFDIENTVDELREEIIVSKNVNDDRELIELFDILLKPEFLIYTMRERQSFVDMLSYYVESGDEFDEIFTRIDTYFDDEVLNQKRFMELLLLCLQRYQQEES